MICWGRSSGGSVSGNDPGPKQRDLVLKVLPTGGVLWRYRYRLVVEVQYQAGIVWVKFVGTHAQYDRIDVESVNDY